MTQSNKVFGKKYLVFLLVFLGMLSAFGPFVTDMYLPVLPAMAEIFDCSASTAQLGLTMSLIGLAAGQLFFGPLSDKYGRRPVLISSMILFIVSTIVILFSPTMQWFNVCRLFQGIGGAGGIVLSRSIATDYYSGRDLAKILAIIGAINGIAPVVSPVAGGLVSTFTGWQGIFVVLLVIGLLIVSMCLAFRESHPVEKRTADGLLKTFASFIKLLRLPYYVVYVLIYAFGCAILLAYISSASFIIQNHYSYSPLVFSICFAVNSVFIGVGSGLSVKIKKSKNAAMIGAVLILATCICQLIICRLYDSFIIYESATVIILTGIGYLFTASTTLAMSEGKNHIGSASAIFGAMGFLFGGLISPIVGIGNILYSTMTAMLVCATVIIILTVISFRRKAA